MKPFEDFLPHPSPANSGKLPQGVLVTPRLLILDPVAHLESLSPLDVQGMVLERELPSQSEWERAVPTSREAHYFRGRIDPLRNAVRARWICDPEPLEPRLSRTLDRWQARGEPLEHNYRELFEDWARVAFAAAVSRIQEEKGLGGDSNLPYVPHVNGETHERLRDLEQILHQRENADLLRKKILNVDEKGNIFSRALSRWRRDTSSASQEHVSEPTPVTAAADPAEEQESLQAFWQAAGTSWGYVATGTSTLRGNVDKLLAVFDNGGSSGEKQ